MRRPKTSATGGTLGEICAPAIIPLTDTANTEINMDLDIKLRTPGDFISIQSMYGIFSVIIRETEISVIEALSEDFPLLSRTKIRAKVRNNISISLLDTKKGSFELLLAGTAATAIVTVLSNLASDLIKDSPQWKNFKESTYNVADKAAKNLKERLANKNKLGPFIISHKNLEVSRKNKGAPKLTLDFHLARGAESEYLLDTESIVEKVQRKRSENESS